MSCGWTRQSRDWKRAIMLAALAFALGAGRRVGLSVTLDRLDPPQAVPKHDLKSHVDESARQVTLFAILATPGPPTVDPGLVSVRGLLRKVLPGHGFKLLDVQNKRIETSQSVTCDLGHGYKAKTVLVRPSDEAGKVHLRCVLSKDGKPEFSTLVKTPVNQLFFYERSLGDGTKVMIGVGARESMKV
ncbi:MAG: hypothetical protein ACP5XB_19060, partial [Isosphaeraceae bacterium]